MCFFKHAFKYWCLALKHCFILPTSYISCTNVAFPTFIQAICKDSTEIVITELLLKITMTNPAKKFYLTMRMYIMSTRQFFPLLSFKRKSDCLFHVERKTKERGKPNTSFFSIVFQCSSPFMSNSVYKKRRQQNLVTCQNNGVRKPVFQ